MKGRRVLAILAHPDDESFGLGAGLAKLADEGAEVVLACATGGECGMMPAELLQGGLSAAEVRHGELICAAKELGIAEVRMLGYRDSGMEGSADNDHPQALVRQPVEAVSEVVRGLLREFQPEIVLTHDPVGGYFHPDHIALHQAVRKAFLEQVEDLHEAYHPLRLFYHLIPRGMIRIMATVLPLLGRDPRRFGENQDIDLVKMAAVRLPIHARVYTRPWQAVRDRASACHASQVSGSLTSEDWQTRVRRLLGGHDLYMQGWPEPGRKVLRNLFEGIEKQG